VVLKVARCPIFKANCDLFYAACCGLRPLPEKELEEISTLVTWRMGIPFSELRFLAICTTLFIE
jgi:hypothetical protein